MLVSSEIVFNQVDFDRRLRHYFSDSAPVAVRYKLGVDYVEITVSSSGNQKTISLMPGSSVEENVRRVIEECEESLYPRLVKYSEQIVPVPADVASHLLSKGKTLVEIMEGASKLKKEHFMIITRIGLNNNTLVLREVDNGIKTVYELLYIPVLKFLERLEEKKFVNETAYDYLLKNSRIVATKTE